MSEVRTPTHRPPTTPGEFLREIIDELGFTQQRFADALSITRPRLAEIISGRRRLTPDTALRLARVLGMSEQFWLNAQLAVDVYDLKKSSAGKSIAKLKKLSIPEFQAR